MPRITLYLKDAEIRSEVSGILTSGMAGVEVNLICDDSWDGLLKTLVCRTGDIAKSVLVKNDRAVVAHEALVEGKWLELGVEGRNEDGSVVIPTLWERCCIVMPGTDAQADPTADPTLPIWGQLQKRVEALEIPPIPVEIGALPRPMVAKIGQFFRVADVNQIGAVVAVEAVDMPSGGEYALPVATAETLGGVKAEPATEDDTQPVRISGDGMLFTAPGGGGGEKWEKIADVTTEMDLESIQITEDQNGKPFSLKKVFILIEAHPALQEGSSQTLIGLNFTTAHAWSASFARFRGPANENEWGLRQLVVSVAEDGLLIPINALTSYNDTNMRTQLNGLKDDKNFIDYTTATAGRTYVSTETWIDIIHLGSYTQAVGKGTRLIVYGVRA